MVPRAFLFSSARLQEDAIQNEKNTVKVARQAKGNNRLLPSPGTTSSQLVVADSATVSHTSPVIIPPKTKTERNGNFYADRRAGAAARRDSASSRQSTSAQTLDRNLPSNLATLLETTAIPRRSRSIRGSRKLPRGNHVEAFSRLLMDGVKVRDDYTNLDGTSNSPLDYLLSPPDEHFDDSLTSTSHTDVETPQFNRTFSTDSVPSLDNDLDSYTTSGPDTPSSSSAFQRRATFERRKQLSPPQECATDHPLLDSDVDSLDSPYLVQESTPVPSPENRSLRNFPRLGFTFKSNLTASLRAIKSAAQTVSNFATPSVRPDDFLTRSLFSITPELTDDRRPLPLSGPPSPALRRYLNPITLSPAEMHVYHDYPQDISEGINSCPVSIQMQTYNRSGSADNKGPFSTRDGNNQQTFLFDPELPSSRQREPRENSDFLRMVVLEMNMRRKGKLRDDIPTRARIWLPPRKTVRLASGGYDEDEPAIPQRWIGISIERIEN
jgi:hypothetical protein